MILLFAFVFLLFVYVIVPRMFIWGFFVPFMGFLLGTIAWSIVAIVNSDLNNLPSYIVFLICGIVAFAPIYVKFEDFFGKTRR